MARVKAWPLRLGVLVAMLGAILAVTLPSQAAPSPQPTPLPSSSVPLLLRPPASTTPSQPAAPVPAGKRTLPAPTQLTGTPQGKSNISLTWVAPNDTDMLDPITGYYVFRNGTKIVALRGANGTAPTSYIDTPNLNGPVTYTVAAYSGSGVTGQQSMPFTTTASAAPPASAATTPGPLTSPDNNQDDLDLQGGSQLCKLIPLPDLRGDNEPTPAEKYRCTKAMTSLPNKYGTGWNVTDDILRFWAFLLTIGLVGGIALWLIANAIFGWSLQLSTYTGFAAFMASIVQGFGGSQDFVALRAFGWWSGFLMATFLILRMRLRKAMIISLSVVFLFIGVTWFVQKPSGPIGWIATKPPTIEAYVIGRVQSLSHGTGGEGNYGLVEQPTYNGNEAINSMRKEQNQDWLIHQYLPMCADWLGDPDWGTNPRNTVPGTSLTWCEYLMRSINGDKGYDKNYFDSKLKAANPTAEHIYAGKDLGTRTIVETFTIAADFFHTLLLVGVGAVTYIFVALAIISTALLVFIGIGAMPGFEALRQYAWRQFGEIVTSASMPVLMGAMVVLTLVIENFLANEAAAHGFAWVMGFDILFTIGMMVFIWMKAHDLRRMGKSAFNGDPGRVGSISNPTIQKGAGALVGAMVSGGVGAYAGSKFGEARQKERDEEERRAREGNASAAPSASRSTARPSSGGFRRGLPPSDRGPDSGGGPDPRGPRPGGPRPSSGSGPSRSAPSDRPRSDRGPAPGGGDVIEGTVLRRTDAPASSDRARPRTRRLRPDRPSEDGGPRAYSPPSRPPE